MSERLAKSAGLIGVATLMSRVLGLVRDSIQGAYFGTSDANDAFVVATRFPTLLRDLFAEGAMSAAFVPTFTRVLTKQGRDAAWRLGSLVVNALAVVTGIAVILGIAFAKPLAGLIAADYADTPNKLELTTLLARVNMPFLFLVAIAVAFMGMLNALRRFALPATAPAMYNVAFIACTVIFVPVFMRLGIQPVMALSVGMLLGGVAQIALQWPALRKEGYRHRWVLDWRDPALREVLILMGPGTLGVAAAQINLLTNTWLATSTPHAVSALGYAFRLMYMPIGIFGVSVATAALPDLARQAAEGAHDQMRTTFSSSMRLMLMLSVPAVIGLMVLAVPIVQLLFERRAFNPESTALTARALFFYAPGVLGYSVVKIVSPIFYSMQDTRTPVIASVLTIALNLVLNLSLNRVMGFQGLALGTAIAANLNAGLLIYLLSRRLNGIDGARIGRAFVKMLVASALMGAAAYLVVHGLEQLWPGSHFLPRLVRVSAGIGVGLAVLGATAHFLHMDEFRVAMRRVLARLKLGSG
jgi:putative peptidoglycan lipid II flippase